MKDELDKQLSKDGQAIKDQAIKRISSRDFSAEIESKISKLKTKTQPNKKRSWLYGLAAAISLSVLVWATIKQPEVVASNDAQIILANNTININLEQLPETIEKTINQPLLQEQQAIIDDLKSLKDQLLSI